MELMAMQERHKAGKKFFDLVKLYGPGYGLAATLIGQIGMFGSLGTGGVDELGAMLAVAVTATLYGTLLANAIAGPMGDKLSLRSGEEIMSKEMMLQGVLSIHAGDNPRATFELNHFAVWPKKAAWWSAEPSLTSGSAPQSSNAGQSCDHVWRAWTA